MNQVSKNDYLSNHPVDGGMRAKARKTLKGIVVSDKMLRTVVVSVTELKKHRRYHKFYKSSKKYKAHDANSEYHMGDRVLIEETRPISRDKNWRVIKKLKVESEK